jgi:hypothetical protein
MSSPFSVKAQLADDIRRVRIPTDVAGAAASLGATFATDPALIQIYWTDEDGDLITIKTDDDLQEAIRSGATRLIIKEGLTPAVTTMSPVATPSPPPASAPTPTPTPTLSATTPQTAGNAAEDLSVHYGVVCDISGMNPITGARYQMAGYDYDLCEAEFNKLSEEDRSNFVVIATRGAKAVRYQPKAAPKPAPAPAPAPKAPAPAPKAPAPAPASKPAAAAAEPVEAVHHHISCDKSGMNPITGARYHLAGVNYDLCEAEFNKLSEAEKAKFVVIAHRGARPTPYGQEAAAAGPDATEVAAFEQFMSQVFGVDAAPAIQQIKVAFEDVNAEVAKKFAEHKATAAARGHRTRGGCPMRGGRHGGMSGWHQKVANASVSLGDRLPAAPLGFRSFGPGVAQLQIALIKAGVLDESAIRMHTGKYGPRTAEAVCSLQNKYSLGGEPGVFDDNVAAILIGKLDGTIAEPVAEPVAAAQGVEVEIKAEVEVEAAAPAPSPEQVYPTLVATPVTVTPVTVVAPSAPAAAAPPPSKWQSELEVLAGMGFTDNAVLVPLLEKHTGSIIFVMTELLG